MSVAIENFVKAIYKNDNNDSNDTKPGNIAKKLGISNAAATDMAKKLASKNLLQYEKYQALQLTDEGTKMALNVIRKHRLWEALLFKLFDMSLHEIHRESELLEHATSNFLADRISEYLGNPKFDPHGDPIPNANGEITTIDTSMALSNTQEGKTYVISRLMSDDKEFFDFCALNGLKYGNPILVTKQFSKNKMTQITIKNNNIVLNEDFTNIIYVNEISS
ncbi:MAG: Fur family transcriptional regulator [Xanthomarina sp.]|uniref:metal-dependent transcriptional regulator n=1 Tax=Xanthomarina sp. TaxID=1931211 RepID=UPI000C4CA412|nr:metal-dependent transcriptional regulator [Xanthomarina sp.]MAL22596.1 Fur family transcriptional regulator [Xanthomarina sp.]MBF61139.1 Fur family transcriptional regulator [Xanthomarina sp.]HAB26738.1 metal-dependent transcriptional regulator [Xanthomarina gelatinilytica]|tara:strand:- start:731 stop:1393 length:663 start_codon:yes stop_codon:yes gene_type:complete